MRCRRRIISTISATLSFNAVHPTKRDHGTELYMHRLVGSRYIEACKDEVAAVVQKHMLLDT